MGLFGVTNTLSNKQNNPELIWLGLLSRDYIYEIASQATFLLPRVTSSSSRGVEVSPFLTDMNFLT